MIDKGKMKIKVGDGYFLMDSPSEMVRKQRLRTKKEQELKGIPSPWIVVGKDKCELSLVRKNNIHGQRSYGWYEEGQKVLISRCEDNFSDEIWDKLKKFAEELCVEWNEKEGWEKS